MGNKIVNPRSFTIRITALIIMALLCIAAVLYARGVFDISFLNRNAGASSDDTTEYDTQAPIETGEAPEYTDVKEAGTLETAAAGDVVFEDATALAADGYKTDGTELYSADKYVLAKAALALELPAVYTYRQMWEAVEVKKDAEEGGYVAATEYQLTDRKVLTLYAGYMMYDCAGTMYLIDSAGNPLATYSDDELTPAYAYDCNGLPLFLYNGRYCYYDSATAKMIESDINKYNPDVDNIGVYFEHPFSYGSGDGVKRYRNDKWMWSFINSQNDDVFKYYGLYNFSESLAAAIELKIREVEIKNEAVSVTVEGGNVVVDESGNPKTALATVLHYERNYELNYLDENGTVKLTGDKTYINSGGRVVVASWQTPLITKGKYAMGYLYFEYGLVRVRETTQDLYMESKKILSDTDYIIRSDGTRFPLPAGYNVVSYSNGIILLEKDGKYGYMNYEGKWIAQPIYTYAEPFYEGLAVLGFTDGKKAMIDTTGAIAVPFAFDYISNASAGIITMYDSSIGWQVVYKMTK